MLSTIAVDITMLASTFRAIGSKAVDGKLASRPRLRDRLQNELRRAAAAYVNTLARSKRPVIDDEVLAACRTAAEHEMPKSLRHRHMLEELMRTQDGALDDMAAARQDLWRLAHLAVHLRHAMAALETPPDFPDQAALVRLHGQLRRRVRRALVAYARSMHRSKPRRGRCVPVARTAALEEIGRRGVAQADRLRRIAAARPDVESALHQGVVRPLKDLVIDWSAAAAHTTAG
jgi:hypothetical protein